MWVKQDVIIVEWRIWDTTRDDWYSIKRFEVNKKWCFFGDTFQDQIQGVTNY